MEVGGPLPFLCNLSLPVRTAKDNHGGGCLYATNTIVVMDDSQIWVNNTGAFRGGVAGLYDYSILFVGKVSCYL